MQEVDFSLPLGTQIGDFKIISILGVGGFGITYKAEDTQLQRTVALKEFLPTDLAARTSDSYTVMPRTNVSEDFQYGLTKFLDEARTLAGFNHPNIVSVLTFVKENGTAYLVMEYIEGEALDDHLKKIHFNGNTSEARIREIIEPILDGLLEVHNAGLLHRDIKPGNIYLKNTRTKGNVVTDPMLIDFGAARQSVGEKSKSMSAIVSDGYAPTEQYNIRSRQGAWTDLYAIGAVMYQLIMGEKPEPSTHRQNAFVEDEPDPIKLLPTADSSNYSQAMLDAITACLTLKAKARPQTVAQLQKLLSRETQTDITNEKNVRSQDMDKTRKIGSNSSKSLVNNKKPSKSLWFVFSLIVFCGLGYTGYKYQQLQQAEKTEQQRLVAIVKEKKLAVIAEESRLKEAKRLADIEEQKRLEEQTLKASADKADRSTLFEQANNAYNNKNYTTAFKIYSQLARLNEVKSQYNLGYMYDNGEGVKQSSTLAVQWYLKAAEQGYMNAQHNLGHMYDNGRGVQQSSSEAVKWYRKSVEQGYSNAQTSLGYMYSNGRGVQQSDSEAVKWYRKAAEQGDMNAENNLGYMYENGRGVQQSDIEAVKWYLKASEKGDINAQTSLGYMYDRGRGVKQSSSEAIKWYRKAAIQGYKNAQHNVGYMYDRGRGVKQSPTEAVKWYRQAAEQGFMNAQHNLGYMYSSGRGVQRSDIEAVKWYRKAAEQGFMNAQNNLGYMYSSGRGVKQSSTEAVKWYRQAAVQGFMNAQHNLGYMYDKGRGVKQSDTEAASWYRKAAEQGYKDAQLNLALKYQKGQGVKQSSTEAEKWFRKAAKQGDEAAKNELKKMGLNG
jgi:TPR repeat protein